MMFKRDNNVRYVNMIGSTAYWILQKGKLDSKMTPEEKNTNSRMSILDDVAYQCLLVDSKETPALIMDIKNTRKRWWLFRGEIYCEDEGLAIEDLKILILDRIEQGRKRIKRATARLSTAADADGMKRRFIPDDVRMHVWQRDRGRCVRCGSQAKLEFDHIIPISKGGSDTARNIQLLCESCNREKGGNLV